jgi:Ca2+-binding RTX toxin-like protein
MPDSVYVLDLQVTGAELVTVNDASGVDSIVVNGVYDEMVEISLGWSQQSGKAIVAGATYFGFDGLWHRLLINGQVENASGSNGRDSVLGNETANWLSGDMTASGLGGNDSLRGGGGDDTVLGGSGADRIYGDSDSDQLFGNDGDDTIFGGTGGDTVAGGSGADVLFGGGSAGDTVSYATSGAAITVRLTFGQTSGGSGGDAAGDVLDGFVDVIGSGFSDTIIDTAAIGGISHNAFWGNAGKDRLLLGGGQDSGYGGSGDDVVTGQAGDDLLDGGASDDRLTGGADQDLLVGGTGADRFIFKSVTDSSTLRPDTIADFATDQRDLIDLRGMDANTALRGNQAFTLIIDGFGSVAGELRLIQVGADLAVQGDIDGDGQSDFAILVLNTGDLTAGNFLL